jgi:hypothetical protein
MRVFQPLHFRNDIRVVVTRRKNVIRYLIVGNKISEMAVFIERILDVIVVSFCYFGKLISIDLTTTTVVAALLSLGHKNFAIVSICFRLGFLLKIQQTGFRMGSALAGNLEERFRRAYDRQYISPLTDVLNYMPRVLIRDEAFRHHHSDSPPAANETETSFYEEDLRGN